MLQVLAQININPTIIPPATAIEPWEKMVPGAAKMFLDQAKQQADHRQGLETRALDYEHQRSMAGISAGKWVVVAAFAVVLFALWRGYPWVAGAISVSGLTGLAGVFVVGKSMTVGERFKKMISMGRAALGESNEGQQPEQNRSESS
jgi:uncharacterized membrane protein